MSAQFILSAAQRYASAVLAGSCGPVSARLSIINRCSLETAWRIELVFGVDAYFYLSYAVF